MLVRDIMTSSVLTLAPDMTLKDAAASLATLGVSGAPVCDAKGECIGVFTKSDVVGPMGDGHIDLSCPIKSFMTAKPLTVSANAEVHEAVHVMADQGVHRLMVLDESGVLVGIVTPMDVLRGISSGKLKLL